MTLFVHFRAIALAAVFFVPSPALAQDRMMQAAYDALMAAPAKPLDLMVAASTKGVVRKVIGPEGGAVALSFPDKTIVTLTIPKGALRARVPISMSALAEIRGLPAPRGPRIGVDLQPSGLRFIVPATLTLDRPDRFRRSLILAMQYEANGYNTVFTPAVYRKGRLIALVEHFSGTIFDEMARETSERDRTSTDAFGDAAKLEMEERTKELMEATRARYQAERAREKVDRARKEIIEALGKERLGQLFGCGATKGDCDPELGEKICTLADDVSSKFYEATFSSMLSPSMTCSEASKIVRDNLGMERSQQLFGCVRERTAISSTRSVKINGEKRDQTMMQLAAKVCDREAESVCRKSGAVADLIQTYLAIQRQMQLLGQTDDETVNIVDKLNTCGKFEVEIANLVKEVHDSAGGCTTAVSAKVTIKGAADWAAMNGATLAEGTATHKVENYTIDLKCEAGDLYQFVSAATETPARIALVGVDVQSLPKRSGEGTAANVYRYRVQVAPGSITKKLLASSGSIGPQPFDWPGWFGDTFLAAYKSKAVGDAVQFEVPETGEHPIVGRTVDLGRADKVDTLISGAVDSTILVRHLPPKIKNGDWEISKLR